MKKRILILPLVLAAMLLVSAAAFIIPSGAATPAIKVSYNNKEITNPKSLLINSVTYVPLRAMSEMMGVYNITWDQKTQTASISTNGLKLSAKVGNLYITANDRCFYTVGKILNIDGRVYVPIRPMARAFGLDVLWDGATYSVMLTDSGSGYCKHGSEYYDVDSLYWLSRIISAEAEVEPMPGKIAVGNVVLNRVASRDYPNSVYAVIFDRKHGIQFTPVATGTIYNTPSQESIVAAKICLEGYSLSDEILFFYNPKEATSSWIARNRPYVMTIENHKFYK
ncbi:MAG TPA: copper amine oxidase [Clostridiales bacterium]|jgi:N-acetylmuramoyl-L-alanine amidase|nr:copper amine oxidase [Clostridiales bacterium]